jgi:hypothetical protein
VPCRRRTPSHVVGRRARHPVVQLRRPCVLAVAAQKCPAALHVARGGNRDSVFYGGGVVYSRFEGRLRPTDSRAVARGHLMVVDIHRNSIWGLFAGGLGVVGVFVLCVRGFACWRRRRLGKGGRLRGEEHCLALFYLFDCEYTAVSSVSLHFDRVVMATDYEEEELFFLGRVRHRVWAIGIRRLDWRFCRF